MDNEQHPGARVLGIILAALAVQYVFNGITGYYDWLTVTRTSSTPAGAPP